MERERVRERETRCVVLSHSQEHHERVMKLANIDKNSLETVVDVRFNGHIYCSMGYEKVGSETK